MYEYTHQGVQDNDRDVPHLLLLVLAEPDSLPLLQYYWSTYCVRRYMDGVSARKFVHLVRHVKYLGSSVGEVLSPIGIRQAELTGGRLQQIVSQGNPGGSWLASCTPAFLGQHIPRALLPNTSPTFL